MSDWSSDVCSSDLATAPASSATADDQIATVLVTARRREESLEKVPTSITALGAQQLAQQGIVPQSDLQAAVPGLSDRVRALDGKRWGVIGGLVGTTLSKTNTQ